MPGTYEIQPDGGALVTLPQGKKVRMMVGEDQLQSLGYAPGSGIPGFTPVVVPQQSAVGQIPGLGDALEGRRPLTDEEIRKQQEVPEAISNDPAVLHALRGGAPVLTTAKEIRQAEEGEVKKRARSLRGGAEVREIDDGAGRSGGGRGSAGGGGGGFLVPGRDQRVGFTKQLGVGKEALDEAEESLADASIDRKLAAQSIALKSQAREEEFAQMYERQIEREERQAREQEQRARLMRRDYHDRLEALDREREAVDRMDVEPDTLFDKEDWAKVVGAITVLAGGIGAAYNGGRNLAVEALQKAQDRSVEKKMRRWEMKQKGLASRESGLDRMVQIFGSPAEAEAELRDRQRSLVKSYGEKMLHEANAEDALAQFRAQTADWDTQRAEGRLERAQRLGDKVVESWAYSPAHVVGGRPRVNEADVQKLAKAREEAGIGAEEGEAANVSDLISELPEGELPTPGSRNVVSRAARNLVDWAGGEGSAAQAFDTDTERAGAAKFSRQMNAIKSKLLGAARSPAEIQDFNEGFANVRTKEGMQQFAADWQRKIQRREAGVKAGFRPEVVETFEERQAERQPTRRASTLRGE